MYTIEWHSPNYTPDSSDFCLFAAYSIRASMFNVSVIPHTEWNGVHGQVGGAGGGNQRFAQGGGKNKSKKNDAIEKAKAMVLEV